MVTKNYSNKNYPQNPFKHYAQEYDNWFTKNENIFLSELLLIKSLLPNTNNCLEVGVGTGRFAQALHINQGVEPSENMKIFAENRGIKVYQAQAESLPFPNNYFNCLLMITTICFIDNPTLALQEAYRVLNNKGHLILGFIDKNSPLGKNYLKTKNQNKFYKTATFYNTSEIIRMLENNHFQIEEIKQTLFQENLNNNILQPTKEGSGEGGFVGIKSKLSAKA